MSDANTGPVLTIKGIKGVVNPLPRITIEISGAKAAEQALLARGVAIPDPVTKEGHAYFGSFLDSEGNKLWFCSFD